MNKKNHSHFDEKINFLSYANILGPWYTQGDLATPITNRHSCAPYYSLLGLESLLVTSSPGLLSTSVHIMHSSYHH